VGVAIGVALAVALDNILLGVGVGVALAAALWTASKRRHQVPVDSQEQKTVEPGDIE
jgi:hypothetical protein